MKETFKFKFLIVCLIIVAIIRVINFGYLILFAAALGIGIVFFLLFIFANMELIKYYDKFKNKFLINMLFYSSCLSLILLAIILPDGFAYDIRDLEIYAVFRLIEDINIIKILGNISVLLIAFNMFINVISMVLISNVKKKIRIEKKKNMEKKQ